MNNIKTFEVGPISLIIKYYQGHNEIQSKNKSIMKLRPRIW